MGNKEHHSWVRAINHEQGLMDEQWNHWRLKGLHCMNCGAHHLPDTKVGQSTPKSRISHKGKGWKQGTDPPFANPHDAILLPSPAPRRRCQGNPPRLQTGTTSPLQPFSEALRLIQVLHKLLGPGWIPTCEHIMGIWSSLKQFLSAGE